MAKHHWRGSCCEQSTVVETWGKKNKVGDERKREKLEHTNLSDGYAASAFYAI